jgi:ABC-type Mn2+/Zn2+ transport system permease subunit
MMNFWRNIYYVFFDEQHQEYECMKVKIILFLLWVHVSRITE